MDNPRARASVLPVFRRSYFGFRIKLLRRSEAGNPPRDSTASRYDVARSQALSKAERKAGVDTLVIYNIRRAPFGADFVFGTE